MDAHCILLNKYWFIKFQNSTSINLFSKCHVFQTYFNGRIFNCFSWVSPLWWQELKQTNKCMYIFVVYFPPDILYLRLWALADWNAMFVAINYSACIMSSRVTFSFIEHEVWCSKDGS
jgi:hypothetical protein